MKHSAFLLFVSCLTLLFACSHSIEQLPYYYDPDYETAVLRVQTDTIAAKAKIGTGFLVTYLDYAFLVTSLRTLDMPEMIASDAGEFVYASVQAFDARKLYVTLHLTNACYEYCEREKLSSFSGHRRYGNKAIASIDLGGNDSLLVFPDWIGKSELCVIPFPLQTMAPFIDSGRQVYARAYDFNYITMDEDVFWWEVNPYLQIYAMGYPLSLGYDSPFTTSKDEVYSPMATFGSITYTRADGKGYFADLSAGFGSLGSPVFQNEYTKDGALSHIFGMLSDYSGDIRIASVIDIQHLPILLDEIVKKYIEPGAKYTFGQYLKDREIK